MIAEMDDLRILADQQIECSERYYEARVAAGNARAELNLILAANLKDIRAEKPNVGIELAQLMLCETNETARHLMSEWQKNEGVYKGLERILDARASKIILEQTLMKRIREGEKYGI